VLLEQFSISTAISESNADADGMLGLEHQKDSAN
jgi:hypothetical protein